MDRFFVSSDYKLTVITGNKRMAGTDANVFVTFHGTDGHSPKFKLTADSKSDHKKLFEKGNEDKFDLSFKSIGDIRTLRLVFSSFLFVKFIIKSTNVYILTRRT